MEGFKATLVCHHFKNDAIKGPQHLILAPQLHEKLAMNERARAYYAPDCPGIIFSASRTLYAPAYMSTVATCALSKGMHGRVTTTDCRHMGSTAWRDYINDPETQLRDLAIQTLDAAATGLMLTSTGAVDTYYDDTNRNRADKSVHKHWPHFREFVKYQANLIKSKE